MSNRELVVFYINYKLSQRNYPLNHIGLAETPGRTEGGGGGAERDGEGGAAETPSRTEGGGGGAERDGEGGAAETAGTTTTPTTHINGTVTNGTGTSTSPPAGTPPSPRRLPPRPSSPRRRTPGLDAVKEALRDSANEFELRYARAFSDLSSQLHITPASAYQSFENVMDEVFRDGVNWGRVVGLFAFGGALCVECVQKEMSPLVARIADWMTVYLDNHIQTWIDGQGGWDRFAEVFGQDAAAESRRSRESFRSWLLAGVTLVTGVVVGSLIAQKRL